MTESGDRWSAQRWRVHRTTGIPTFYESRYRDSELCKRPAVRCDRARTSKGKPMASHARPVKTIGILTSGGDCSGLNAAIRAVVCRAIEGHGWRVLGIRQGTMGLLRRPVEFEELGSRIVTTNILRMGGTILGTTNKGDPFAF